MKAAGKVMLVVVSVVFALAVGELVLRTFDLGPEVYAVSYDNYRLSENPVLGYELLPESPDGRGSISEQGLRDRHYTTPKPDGVFRIAVVGDSITFGLRVPREANYTERLEYLLNAHFRDRHTRYEVLNFGVTGYNITQIAETVRVKLPEFQPDLIVYGYCLNDAQEYSLEMQRLLYVAGEGRHHPEWRRELGRALNGARVFALIAQAYHRHIGWWRARAAPEQRIHWRNDPQFAAILKGDHADYFSRLYAEDGDWSRVTTAMGRLSASPAPVVGAIFPLFVNLQNYPLTTVHYKIARLFAMSAAGAVDLLEPFQRLAQIGNPVSLDMLHPSVVGHWLAAAVVARYLATQGLLPGVGTETSARVLADPKLRSLSLDSVLRTTG